MRTKTAKVLSRMAYLLQSRSADGAARVAPGQGGDVIDISDHFTRWVTFANAGMLEPGNLYAFDYAMRHLPQDGSMLEIGSFCGLSTNMINYYARKHGVERKFFTADRWQFEGARDDWNIGDPRIGHRDYRTFVRDSYLRNLRFFSPGQEPHTIELFSDEFFAEWDAAATHTDVFGREVMLGGELAFAYIDGNHTYDFAMRDFRNTDRHLVPGGFILFDDSSEWAGFEVYPVIQDILKEDRYEVVAQNPHFLLRKR